MDRIAILDLISTLHSFVFHEIGNMLNNMALSAELERDAGKDDKLLNSVQELIESYRAFREILVLSQPSYSPYQLQQLLVTYLGLKGKSIELANIDPSANVEFGPHTVQVVNYAIASLERLCPPKLGLAMKAGAGLIEISIKNPTTKLENRKMESLMFDALTHMAGDVGHQLSLDESESNVVLKISW